MDSLEEEYLPPPPPLSNPLMPSPKLIWMNAEEPHPTVSEERDLRRYVLPKSLKGHTDTVSKITIDIPIRKGDFCFLQNICKETSSVIYI